MPTIRELIRLNRSLVIKEFTREQREYMKDTGYYPEAENQMHLVASKGPDGKADLFYYNRNDYDRPDGVLEEHTFWPSSYNYDGAFSYLGECMKNDGVVCQAFRTTIEKGNGSRVFGDLLAVRCDLSPDNSANCIVSNSA